MKVTVSDNQSQQEKEIKFPVLMESMKYSGRVVMFLSENCGVVVSTKNDYVAVGYVLNNYDKFNNRNYWKPLPNGVKITLENDL